MSAEQWRGSLGLHAVPLMTGGPDAASALTAKHRAPFFPLFSGRAPKSRKQSERSSSRVRGSKWRRHRGHHSVEAGRGFVATRSGRCSDVIQDTMSLVLRTSEEPQRPPRHASLGLFRVLCVTVLFLAAASAHITIREKGKHTFILQTIARLAGDSFAGFRANRFHAISDDSAALADWLALRHLLTPTRALAEWCPVLGLLQPCPPFLSSPYFHLDGKMLRFTYGDTGYYTELLFDIHRYQLIVGARPGWQDATIHVRRHRLLYRASLRHSQIPADCRSKASGGSVLLSAALELLQAEPRWQRLTPTEVLNVCMCSHGLLNFHVEQGETMLEIMNMFYSKQDSGGKDGLTFRTPDLVAGALCAYPHVDMSGSKQVNWCRGVVTSVLKDCMARVTDVDSGVKTMMPVTRLRQLASHFRSLPQQAITVKLWGLRPAPGGMWDPEVSARLAELVWGQTVMCRLVNYENGVPGVLMCDTNGREDVHINSVLIEECLALPVLSDDES
ncbi:hypothetical protein HPB51_021746 [Rhipicephalus microplus]|uniref:Tudor domain-containing protein n=1 Tax=Rhipicephalus microplus TaxID=6941 RepID=A0A9J6DPC3_RHIMP|nr:hypothetical protein HPB51_021746 [Rhipicephalus microplus]